MSGLPRQEPSRAEPPFRDSGPVEGVRGDREVPPADPDRELRRSDAEESLDGRLAAAEARAEEHLNDLRRVAAEFENFRKRAARERDDLYSRANERLVKELLPVLDDLSRALSAAEQHEESAEPRLHEGRPVETSGADQGVPPSVGRARYEQLAEGVRLVHRQLAQVLEKEGLAEIEAEGAFDPHVHEALLSKPSEAAEGTVIEVLQKGYRLGDRVLRPARVAVAVPAAEPPVRESGRGEAQRGNGEVSPAEEREGGNVD